MKYKIGQEVVIRRALGEKGGNSRGEYYHGGNLRIVPLGAKGTIKTVNNSETLYLKLDNPRQGDEGYWHVHPEEIGLSKEEEKQDEQRLRRKQSVLERTLVTKEPIDRPRTNESSTDYDPKFNPREEFVLWMESQFPGITRSYVPLMKKILARKQEVYAAARLACQHGIRTAESCVQETFREILSDLKHSNRVSKVSQKSYDKDFCRYLHDLVALSKQVSGNLVSRNHWHYGTHKVGEDEYD